MKFLLFIFALFSFCVFSQEYTSDKSISGFPLGVCGYQGTTQKRDSDLSIHNSPYKLRWYNKYCLAIIDNEEMCEKSRSKKECEYWRLNIGKFVFPLAWSPEFGCLTDAQKNKLKSSSNMKSIDIGTVYFQDPVSFEKLNAGYFRIFRHTGRYQYEMVAYGSRAPFFTKRFRNKYPWNDSLHAMLICFSDSYVKGLGLPKDKTPYDCANFNDVSKYEKFFNGLKAYGFYDQGSHAYCPVGLGPSL